MNYREKSEKLEKMVEQMENDDLTLEEMVSLYEKSTALYKELEEDLSALEQKVRILTEEMETEEMEKKEEEDESL
ncbi:exodeoxyribonuclease VII, small subunit [Aedoeadaptatus nemausensis]|uniref:Exodeoxyribonuclease 7 small subunit n=1 Tax=Aedoeadaptatus nemausensis TaxID=2582829 RepID=A0A6V6Y0C9_9FIRM|nr:exodeoxyribonuclease VII small subunit [Peptoniphilus nemausensis]CAC9925104.1 exodeoxyribonuclease VII, small subunit [Peptoniphilus nemausensis]